MTATRDEFGPTAQAAGSEATYEKQPITSNKSERNSECESVRVVAIGASAGGLEPLEQLFDAMPTDRGLGFVIIQHLSPDFRSMMDQLLARHSSMTIRHAGDGMKVEANVVYLNPPRTELTIEDGKLHTREHPSPELLSLPIDSFFRSLAEDQGEMAIGIILSGTGSDGSRGGKAIREAGGTLIVQEPTSAKFDSMPRAAIERGTATVTALPQDMPELLRRLVSGDDIDENDDPDYSSSEPESVILSLLERRYGADFGYYKQSTVGRRIRRRALLNQTNSIDKYVEMLKNDMDEQEALYCDLLIGVTSFFRDQEAFDVLATTVLADVASVMSLERPLRVWVAGCASGEEPYSLAILISEFARTHGLTLNAKIFATDIHFNSLEAASAGIYARDRLENMPPELIERYFDQIGNEYSVKQIIRKLVVFSPHNLIKDPPFTRMDLVTCRNLLIYLDDVAQKKVLALFHFSLRKDGALFLGPSESTGDLDGEFETVSKKWRIFKKLRDVRLRESTQLLPLSSSDTHHAETQLRLNESRSSTIDGMHVAAAQRQLLLRAYDEVLKKYAPASLLTDRNGELVHIFGNADKFLSIRSGLFSKRLVDILVPDLKLVVSAGIERALAQHSVPFRRKTTIRSDDGVEQTVSVGIEKLSTEGNRADHLLITLEEKQEPETLIAAGLLGEESDQAFFTQRIVELERDLKVTEESLQSTIEELETSNEELQATNEELMASNEELQSTNEELHSVNEELYTVSAEHQRKIEQLTELTEDMENLLRATDIGTIFLDSELRIRRFTPSAARTFNLVSHDVGRPLTHITYRFEYDDLVADLERVLADGERLQRRIEVEGAAYLLRLLPYDSDRENSSGAVLTIIDINELEQAQNRLSEQRQLYEAIVAQQSDLICRYTPKLELTFVNEAYCDTYGKTSEELIGTSVLDLVPSEYRDAFVASIDALDAGQSNEFGNEHIGADGTKRWFHFTRYAQPGKNGDVTEIQDVGRDLTALKQAQEELAELNKLITTERERLDQIYRATPVMLHSILEDGEIVEVSDYWCEKMGHSPSEVIGRSIYDFMEGSSVTRMKQESVPVLFEGGAVDNVPYAYIRKDGSLMDVRLSAITARGRDGERLQTFSVVFDVTEQKQTERALEKQNEELARINDNLNQFTHIVSHDLTGPLRAIEHTTTWIEQDTAPETRKGIQEHIDRLKDQVGHLGSMLSDLLDYSRAGTSQQAPEIIDLPRALNDMFDVIEKPDGMTLAIKSMPDDIVTYRAPLLLVFRNLLPCSTVAGLPEPH